MTLVPAPARRQPSNKAPASGRRDSARTRQKIFNAAFQEFSREGFSGARMDRIANRAKCNIQMIYRHFKSKAKLYESVLEGVYEDIRKKENELDLEALSPIDSLIKLQEFTFDYFRFHPGFVALLNSENLMRGRFVLKIGRITEMTSNLRHAIEMSVRRGIDSGLLRRDADPVQIYVTIAALSWFHLSNAYTLSAMFGQDLTDDRWRDHRRDHVRSVLSAYLTSPVNPATHGGLGAVVPNESRS